MSYARFGRDSDVYVYASVHGGFACCNCRLADPGMIEVTHTREQLILHLIDHLKMGHKVPRYAFVSLLDEIEAEAQAEESAIVDQLNRDEPLPEE